MATHVADRISMRRDELESSNDHIKARWGGAMIAFLLAAIALVLLSLYLPQL
jgi:hypothetical protein